MTDLEALGYIRRELYKHVDNDDVKRDYEPTLKKLKRLLKLCDYVSKLEADAKKILEVRDKNLLAFHCLEDCDTEHKVAWAQYTSEAATRLIIKGELEKLLK